jgi:hypothetical protein
MSDWRQPESIGYLSSLPKGQHLSTLAVEASLDLGHASTWGRLNETVSAEIYGRNLDIVNFCFMNCGTLEFCNNFVVLWHKGSLTPKNK